MAWAVQSVAEFERWFLTLESGVRIEIAAKISLLQQVGPTLGRPHADTLKGSAYPNMKELRVQIGGTLGESSSPSTQNGQPSCWSAATKAAMAVSMRSICRSLTSAIATISRR